MQTHKPSGISHPAGSQRMQPCQCTRLRRAAANHASLPYSRPHVAAQASRQDNAAPSGSWLHAGLAMVTACSLLLGVADPADSRPLKMTPDEQRNVEIFQRSTPSVVSVTNLAIKRDAFTTNMLEIPQGAGSGFVYDSAGHVVTNYHVINDSANVKVTLGKDEYLAQVVGVDQDKDIAVLQVLLPEYLESLVKALPSLPALETAAPSGPGATTSTSTAISPDTSSSSGSSGSDALSQLGAGRGTTKGALKVAGGKGAGATSPLVIPLCIEPDVDDLQVGQRVFAIGNPFSLDHTLTTGVVSGTGREILSITGRPIQGVIQTDAAINPGNSGGPLLNSAGCVIGMNTAIYSPSGTNTGVGFAIPSSTLVSSVEQILKYGKVVRPVLGISFAPDQAVESLGVKGIMVLSALEGGPAWKAGIQGTTRDEYGRLVLGDIIREVNGTAIKTSSDLYRILDSSKVGDTLDVEVLRGAATQHVDVVLEANPQV